MARNGSKYLVTVLTHWCRVTHICVGILTSIGSDNGLSPGRRKAIILTNAGILLIEPSGTNFSENVIKIQAFSFKKMHLKISYAKWRPFCLGLNVLTCLCCKIDTCQTKPIRYCWDLVSAMLANEKNEFEKPGRHLSCNISTTGSGSLQCSLSGCISSKGLFSLDSSNQIW